MTAEGGQAFVVTDMSADQALRELILRELIRCRVGPFLDRAAPLRGAGPGVSAAAQPLKARAAHAGPHLHGLQI